jgi:hypothetical protein
MNRHRRRILDTDMYKRKTKVGSAVYNPRREPGTEPSFMALRRKKLAGILALDFQPLEQ